MTDAHAIPPNTPAARGPTLVITIHGIRTEGAWEHLVASALKSPHTKIEPFPYGVYSLRRFLTPGYNTSMVNKFYDWYGSVIRSSPDINLDRIETRPSVIAHSFGTWILGMAMLKFSDIRFNKIILAGSILPRDFDWGVLFARDQVSSVLNECGQKDPWPAWAARLVAHTGTGGSEGFEWFSTAVENVRSEWFGHSDALMQTHIEQCWLPFLSTPSSPLALLQGRGINDGELFSKYLDHSGTVIDEKAYGAITNFSAIRIPRGLSRTWIKVNPDIYTFLIDREKQRPAGYLNAMPLEDPAYLRVRNGELADNEIRDEHILPFNGLKKNLKVYLMSIAIEEEHRRWGDGFSQQAYFQLITGFLDKLTFYAKHHGVRVTHFLAITWTQEGRRICESLHMTEVGRDRFQDSIFELDLEAAQRNPAVCRAPAFRKLLKVYREL